MDTIHCRVCGTAYFEGQANYCVKCGSQLPSKLYPEDELKQLEDEPRPYGTLRFTSFLISFIGWILLIIGWVIPILIYPIFLSLARFTGPGESDILPFYSTVENTAAMYAFAFGVINTFISIGVIASGQLYAVLLEIRDDMHVTARLIRRFGLMLSEKNE